MKVNANKTKIMASEKNAVTHYKISMSGQELERAENFKYCRCKLSRDNRLESGVGERVKEARTLKAITRNKNIWVDAMKTLYDSVLIPPMTYGSETWSVLEGRTSEM